MEDLIKMALPAGNGLLFTLFNLILVAVIVIALIITSMRSLNVQLITPQKTRSVSQSVSQSLHWRSLEVTGGHWRSTLINPRPVLMIKEAFGVGWEGMDGIGMVILGHGYGLWS